MGVSAENKQKTQATIDHFDVDSQHEMRGGRVLSGNERVRQDDAKKRLVEVKDVLKNSKTLK